MFPQSICLKVTANSLPTVTGTWRDSNARWVAVNCLCDLCVREKSSRPIELFPILRHAQFEDLLNGTFADPVSGILRAVKPDDEVRCRVEIHIAPAGERRRRKARHAIHLLDREFSRVHYRLAEYFAEHITRRRGWLIAWLLGVLASVVRRDMSEFTGPGSGVRLITAPDGSPSLLIKRFRQ